MVKYTYGSKLVHSDYGWYSYDAHGNVTMLTDDTGAVIKRYDYDPYGVELGAEDSTDENPFRYSGQYTDRETGYVYLRARYYAPSLGRFLSMDMMMDGANWYIYCAGNPVLFLDTNGYEMYTRPDGSVWDRPSASEIRNAEINGWDTPQERLIRLATPIRSGSVLENAQISPKNPAIDKLPEGYQFREEEDPYELYHKVTGALNQTGINILDSVGSILKNIEYEAGVGVGFRGGIQLTDYLQAGGGAKGDFINIKLSGRRMVAGTDVKKGGYASFGPWTVNTDKGSFHPFHSGECPVDSIFSDTQYPECDQTEIYDGASERPKLSFGPEAYILFGGNASITIDVIKIAEEWGEIWFPQ